MDEALLVMKWRGFFVGHHLDTGGWMMGEESIWICEETYPGHGVVLALSMGDIWYLDQQMSLYR